MDESLTGKRLKQLQLAFIQKSKEIENQNKLLQEYEDRLNVLATSYKQSLQIIVDASKVMESVKETERIWETEIGAQKLKTNISENVTNTLNEIQQMLKKHETIFQNLQMKTQI